MLFVLFFKKSRKLIFETLFGHLFLHELNYISILASSELCPLSSAGRGASSISAGSAAAAGLSAGTAAPLALLAPAAAAPRELPVPKTFIRIF